tara:strand:+ start:423 stop:1598 length:1176 start_codon:yes stop_codon:yes gene_type:complete
MKIIIAGGDGFCGWPTSLHLSKNGHEIIIVDNLSRRKIDLELEVNSLTPISSINKRISKWFQLTGNKIKFFNIDISKNYQRLLNLINQEKPDTIIHFAEQRAAPYSMKNSKTKIYTVNNNINSTNNILCAIVESKLDIHLVHLGTMGVYGYSSADLSIPEGYIDVEIRNDKNKSIKRNILYPSDPGSIYHLTKTQDALLFAYYNKNDKVKITDLHQGIVWGTATDETNLDEELINRFDYDGDYGTVLNRFLMQSALNYPLTVHGTGGQTRAFINIKDSVKCLDLAINNPPKENNKVKIFNQMTETHKVLDLAKIVSELTGSKIQHLPNPRNEDQENELRVKNKNFIELGLNPITLKKGLLNEISGIAKKYIKRCDPEKIPCNSYWTSKKNV